MAVADVKLSWRRSPSADITSRIIVITKDGEEETVELGPEVGEFVLEVQASASVSFHTTVYDSEGKVATSETYAFVLGDLQNPLPDTDLFHEVLAVRE